jgi:hypothetical protein
MMVHECLRMHTAGGKVVLVFENESVSDSAPQGSYVARAAPGAAAFAITR